MKATSDWDAPDPHDHKILALTTITSKILDAHETLAKNSSNGNSENCYNNNGPQKFKGEWAAKPTDADGTEVIDGVSVRVKKIKGRRVLYCEKCNGGEGGWSTSHATHQHRGHVNTDNNSNSSNSSGGNSNALSALRLNADLRSALTTLQNGGIGEAVNDIEKTNGPG